ncbi:CopY/TcrY family copper transport repressor (plasmid) [Jeotgalibaca sp. MA1X17-3]|uniref:CopY/TcrY family copper transport repressor n=1 Tax=Jeotgalibaca sp. MA1X17-3 TaxID=2908211 RepID=UPI001F473FA4|nr:CopY/TcrY family copper transport repressor [Jeotgalibaca sp. MA1X17-3]UJF16807.1 CopY/TcrY family copper transport repressor [Jeotgalibaca sp. MA1X17-3]
MLPTLFKITDAEWEIMRVVWANEAVTSKEIIAILKNKKQWKAATIKTLIGRLVEKGALHTLEEGRKFIYSAAITQEESMDVVTKDVLSRVCNKRKGHVISTMIADTTLSSADIFTLKALLEQKSTMALNEVLCECVSGQCECEEQHH